MTSTKITKDVEEQIVNLFSTNNGTPATYKEILEYVESKLGFGASWVNGLDAHVAWALDMIHSNNLIKRVGPRIWEAVEGPDDVYSERETGYAPEGEFVNRGRNFNSQPTFKTKVEFNREMDKAESSVKILKEMGKTKDEAFKMLINSTGTVFNPVAVKVSLNKLFKEIT